MTREKYEAYNMDKRYCTIYLARHGETEANVLRITQGHSSSPLTDKGKMQAKSLGENLHDVHFDAIFSSDLERAKHTAEIAALDRKISVQTSQLLREKSFGTFEGGPIIHYIEALQKIVSEETEPALFMTAKLGVGDESEAEVASRVIRFLREIAVAYEGKTVLVVSHGAAIRILLAHLGFGTRKELLGSVSNAAYIKLESDGIDFFVKETFGVMKKV